MQWRNNIILTSNLEKHRSGEKLHESISVILTVFNGQKFLQETIVCLSKNREFIHQIIVIDDASRDNSKQIILENRRLFDLVVFHSQNLGVAKSRQEGVHLATGDWIHIVDQDDLFPPDFHRKASGLFPFSDLILSEMNILNSVENRIYQVINLKKRKISVEHFLTEGSPAPTQSQIIGRRTLFLQHHFLPFPGSDDADFLLRTLEKKPRIGILTGVPVHWRWHQTNSSYTTLTNPNIIIRLLENFVNDFPQYRSLLPQAKSICLRYAATLRKKIGKPWIKMIIHSARLSPGVMFSKAGLYLLLPEILKMFLRKCFGKRVNSTHGG